MRGNGVVPAGRLDHDPAAARAMAPASEPVPAGYAEALGAWPSAVTLLTIADGRDDIGTTVSAFSPVSADPPLVLVSLIAESYPAEVLGRAGWLRRDAAGRVTAGAGRPVRSRGPP